MLTQEAIFIATIKGTSLVIKTRPLGQIVSTRVEGRSQIFSVCIRVTAVQGERVYTNQNLYNYKCNFVAWH